MDTAFVIREVKSGVLPVGVVFVCGLSAIVLSMAGGLKLMAAVVGAIAVVVVAYLSGNPRLFCLWAMMTTLPLALAKKFGEQFIFGGGENAMRLEISDVFTIALAGFIAVDIIRGRRVGFRIPKVSYAWMAIMLMGVVAMFATPWIRMPAYETIRMGRMLLLFLVVANELERPNRVFHCIAGLTLGLIANAIIGMIELAKGANLGLEILGETSSQTIQILAQTSVVGHHPWRVSGLLLHPNLFGAYLAALLPAVIAGFLVARGKLSRLYFLAGIALGVPALIATESRSGWVSFAASFTVLMLLTPIHAGMRRRSFITAAIAAASVFIVLGVFANKIEARLFDSKVGATTAREEFIRDARRMISEHMVWGVGLNNYTQALPPYMKVSESAYDHFLPPVHNIYYMYWAETGLVGLSLFLLMWGSLFVTGFSNLAVADERLFTINVACIAGLLAFVVDGFFSFTLRVNNDLKVYWVLAGIILAIRYWRLTQAQTDEPEPVEESSDDLSSEVAPVPVQA